LKISLGRLRKDEKIESCFEVSPMFGMALNTYNNTSNSSILGGMDMSYYRLYRLNRFTKNKINTKIGGNIMSTNIFRLNTALGNNAIGFENIMNIMTSVKVSYDFSRTNTKLIKLWFLKKELKPKRRELSYMFNLGLLNMNYRPGYAYSFDSFDGENLNWFADYRFSVNGVRFKSRFDFTRFLTNGNATQLSLIFDIMTAPGKFEYFQFAQNSFMFTWLFNNK